LLRDSEYFAFDKLTGDGFSRVWAVDASGLFGGVFTVRLPNAYRLVSEERFPERYRYRMDLIVREYVRSTRGSRGSARVGAGL